MGKCKYCGQDSGLFSSAHSECRRKFEEGASVLKNKLQECFSRKEDFYLYAKEIRDISQTSFVTGGRKEDLYVEVLDAAIDNYLNDGIIDATERQTVARFVQFSELPQSVLNRNHSLEKLVQSEILQDIVNGRKPSPKITISGSFPFLLAKNESFIWLFRNVVLHEQKVRKEYAGRSRGMSFRICKGVYYRAGGFKGRPIETTYMQKIGVGSACLTDRHIYFSSPEKSVKIPYNKLINVETYSNGIGLQKDGPSAKPIFLEGVSSWFCYNVIANMKD